MITLNKACIIPNGNHPLTILKKAQITDIWKGTADFDAYLWSCVKKMNEGEEPKAGVKANSVADVVTDSQNIQAKGKQRQNC